MPLPDSNEAFQHCVMQLLAGTVRAVGCVLPRNVELVLHDLRKPETSIVEIVNAHVTGRKQGDSVLAGLRTDKAFVDAMTEGAEPVVLVLDYATSTGQGKPLRSSSAFYRISGERPFASVCVNVDKENIGDAIRILQGLAQLDVAPPAAPAETAAPGHDHIEDLIQEIIGLAADAPPERGRAGTKQSNLLAVQRMQERGMFLIKGAVEKAASALGVSRYTIYNYLDELKKADA